MKPEYIAEVNPGTTLVIRLNVEQLQRNKEEKKALKQLRSTMTVTQYPKNESES